MNMPMRSSSNKPVIITGLLLLAVGAALSVFAGNEAVSTGQLWAALVHPDQADPAVLLILRGIRLPRTAACLLVGSSLSAAGLLLQESLNNRLASPGVMGINNGAGLFVLLSALLFGRAPAARMGFAFLGALCALLLVYVVAGFAGSARSTLVLAGVAVSALMSALAGLVITLKPALVVDRTAFQLGSLQGIEAGSLWMVLIPVLPALAAAYLLAPGIELFALGDETAGGLGLSVSKFRLLTILTAALLAGAAVSIAGMIGYIGLIVPNLIKNRMGTGCRARLTACLLFGAALLLLADLLARQLAYPWELPVGMLLSLLGVPFFIFLLAKRKRGRR